jgi:hypothetical protein
MPHTERHRRPLLSPFPTGVDPQEFDERTPTLLRYGVPRIDESPRFISPQEREALKGLRTQELTGGQVIRALPEFTVAAAGGISDLTSRLFPFLRDEAALARSAESRQVFSDLFSGKIEITGNEGAFAQLSEIEEDRPIAQRLLNALFSPDVLALGAAFKGPQMAAKGVQLARAGFSGARTALPEVARVVRPALARVVRPALASERGGFFGSRAVSAQVDDVASALRIPGVDLRQAELMRLQGAIADPTEQAIIHVARQVRDASPLRPADILALRSTELSKKVGRGAAVLEAGEGQAAFAQSKAQLRGALPNPRFVPPEISSEQLHLLTERVRKHPDMQFFTKQNTNDALQKLLAGEVPTKSELVLLEKAFGSDLVDAFILRTKTFKGQVGSFVLDVMLLPKTIRSAYDISFPFRQGFLLGARNPVEWTRAFKNMLQAARVGKAREINQELFGRARKLGLIERGPNRTDLFLPDVERAAGGSSLERAREEAFLSRFSEKIPGIRFSQRTFNTFGNKLKVDVAEKAIRNWTREGTQVTPDMLDSLNRFLNIFTGRGTLGKAERVADFLNIPFWSPRLLASRFQAPFLLADPVVRKMAAQNLAASFGLGMSILGIVKWSGLGDVELDPRSSDFGQIRLGRARINFWAGFQQIARYMAQIALNQSKNRETGDIMEGDEWPHLSRTDRILQFGRSKLAPGIPTMLANEMFGKSFLGEDLGDRIDRGRLPDPIDEFFDRFGINSVREVEAIQQVIPLAQLDMVDAIDELAFAPGLGWSIMAFVGIGTQIFNEPRDPTKAARQAAQRAVRQAIRQEPLEGVAPKENRKVSGDLGEIAALYDAKQEQDDQALANNVISHFTWRERRSERATEYRGYLKGLGIEFPRGAKVFSSPEASERYFELIRNLADSMPNNDIRAEVLAVGWYSIVLEERNDGEKDFIKFFAMRDAYEASLSAEDIALLREALNAKQTPTEIEFLEDSKVMRPYFDLTTDALRRTGQLDIYALYISKSPKQREAFLDENPDLARTLRVLVAVRKAWKEENPEEEALLLKWDHLSRPTDRQARLDLIIENEIRARAGEFALPPETTTAPVGAR